MQGSASEHSHALDSGTLQNVGFHLAAKPCLEEAIKHLVLRLTQDVQRRHVIVVADLGCAHGRNTLDCADFIVRSLLENLACSSATATHSYPLFKADLVLPEIQYFFSDLPSNDFNALFHSLEQQQAANNDVPADNLPPKFFSAGVPGSFYDRLFPTASLDLVICSYALHWLSQVPPPLVDQTSPAWNGGHIWISSTKPSKPVIAAYAQQAEADLRIFLGHRAHELTSGGILFLLLAAAERFNEEMESVSANYFCEFLLWAWKEMVDEGLIASESMEMFNISWYFFNQQELEIVIKDVPDFKVLQMESITNMPFFREQGDRTQTVEQWVRLVSNVVRPAVEAHMGKKNTDELFKKLKTICLNHDCFDVPITHSATVALLQRL